MEIVQHEHTELAALFGNIGNVYSGMSSTCRMLPFLANLLELEASEINYRQCEQQYAFGVIKSNDLSIFQSKLDMRLDRYVSV
jgi:hypothetical protein